MDTHVEGRANAGQVCCPFLCPVETKWISPVQGYCQGLPNGLTMIPAVEQFRIQCTTEGFTACPIYRSRMEKIDLPDRLEIEYRRWALCSLGGGLDVG